MPLLLLAFVLAGCSDPVGLNGHQVRRVTQMHSRPAWSADGRTIFYTDRSGAGVTTVRVKAFNIASGNDTELASVAALNHGEQVRTINNPGFLYVSIAQANWSLQLNLYSLPTSGGAVQAIATNVGTPWFVASADGGKVAYQGSRYDSDTIYIATRAAQSAQVRFPSIGQRPRVVSMSPDGSLLIYESTTGLYLTRTDGSSARAISPAPPAKMAPQVVWIGEAPHLLIAEQTADSIALLDFDASSGSRSRLSALPKFTSQAAGWQLARSTDGQTLAVWVPVELTDYNVERSTYRYRLYVKRPADREPVAALELTADEPSTWFEFSPDGRQLALLLRGSLYLVNLD